MERGMAVLAGPIVFSLRLVMGAARHRQLAKKEDKQPSVWLVCERRWMKEERRQLLNWIVKWNETMKGKSAATSLFRNEWSAAPTSPKRGGKPTQLNLSFVGPLKRHQKERKELKWLGQSEVDLLGVIGGCKPQATSQQKRRANSLLHKLINNPSFLLVQSTPIHFNSLVVGYELRLVFLGLIDWTINE